MAVSTFFLNNNLKPYFPRAYSIKGSSYGIEVAKIISANYLFFPVCDAARATHPDVFPDDLEFSYLALIFTSQPQTHHSA